MFCCKRPEFRVVDFRERDTRKAVEDVGGHKHLVFMVVSMAEKRFCLIFIFRGNWYCYKIIVNLLLVIFEFTDNFI